MRPLYQNMDFTSVKLLLAEAQPLTRSNQTADSIKMFLMMGLMVVVFYFLLIRPQQKRQREHNELLKTIKPGDKVVVSGGIIGVVITVKEKSVTVRSADAKIEVTKGAVGEILERAGAVTEV
jgi:preprotein translocase subunit YajC